MVFLLRSNTGFLAWSGGIFHQLHDDTHGFTIFTPFQEQFSNCSDWVPANACRIKFIVRKKGPELVKVWKLFKLQSNNGGVQLSE